MRKVHVLSLCCGGIAVAGVSSRVGAQIVVDGSLDAGYGSALATQTVQTEFGANTDPSGASASGSELDAAYGTIQNGTLYLFFAGNVQDGGSPNHINVFIGDGRAGQAVLEAAGGSYLDTSNGSVFSGGFSGTYAVDVNDYNGTLYTDTYDLTNAGALTSGNVALTGGVGNNSNVAGIAVGFNNTNTSAIGAGTGAADQTAAAAVTTGLELAIPLSVLGGVTGPIRVLADINGSGDNFLSNQFLPGQPVGTGNLASPTFDFGGGTGYWFTVAAPNNASPVTSTWNNTGGGSWNSTGNWTNAAIPENPSDTANFLNNITSNATVTVDGNWTVGAINFNSTNSYTIAPGTGTTIVMYNQSGGSAAITDLLGTHIISADLGLDSNTTVTATNSTDQVTLSSAIDGPGGLTIAGNGTVTLGATNSAYYGITTVNSGATLVVAASGALPFVAAVANNGSMIVNSGSTLGVVSGAGTTTVASNTTVSSDGFTQSALASNGTTYFNNDGAFGNVSGTGTMTVNASGNYTAGNFAQVSLANNGALSISGIGVVSGNVTGTGVLTVGDSLGVSQITQTALANNGSTVINGSGTSSTIGTVSGTGTLTVSSGTSTFTANAFAQTGFVNNGFAQINGAATVGTVTGSGALSVGTGTSTNTFQLTSSGGQSSQSSVTVTTGSTLDITNNSVILNTGTPNPSLTTYQTLASNGYNNGNWNGTTSITSSWVATQDAGSGPRYGVAVVESANDYVANLTSSQIEITPALLGDTNVDGVVDFTDYLTVSTDFGKTGQDWEEGNFDYSPTGTVDFTDYLDVATNFGDDSSLSASDLASMESFANENGYTLIANADNVGFQVVAVPEPATAGLMALAGLGLLRRRRRRQARDCHDSGIRL